MEIAIKVIQFPEANPLPYVPAFYEWVDHVKACVQCAHADQLVKRLAESQDRSGEFSADPDEMERLFNLLCEGGMKLQHAVSHHRQNQHEISMWN